MDPIIVLHDTTREYIYPVDRNKLRIKLSCSPEEISSCKIIYWNRFNEAVQESTELVCVGRDGKLAHFTCELFFHEATRYIRYYFVIQYGTAVCYFGRDGLSSGKPVYFLEYLCTNEQDVITVPDWAKGSILYQIFPERFNNGEPLNDPENTVPWNSMPTRENFFGGDLRGILSKLDYLQKLKIDALYLTPIFKAPSNHKYDTVDYFSIDPSFGDLDDLKELVWECHARNIKILLDGVFNHCGYYFPPFQDVIAKGAASEFKDWFYIDSFPVQTDPPNYECVGYYKWMPKMRFGNPDVRKYFIEVGTYWLKTANIDGWRLDVADEVDFTFWQEFRRAIKSVNPDVLLIAETWKNGRDMLRGDQMDSVMNYLFRDAVVDYFATGTTSTWEFEHLIQRMLFLYPVESSHVLYNLLGSHDTPRFLSLCKGNLLKMQLAVAFQMTFPGMPAIYYADEIGTEGDNDPDCRKAMDWRHINKSLWEFYRMMISIRKSSPSLRYGDYRSIYCDGEAYGFARHFEGETTYVVLNNSDKEKFLVIPLFEHVSELGELLGMTDKASFQPEQVAVGETFFNSDIHHYRSKFNMVLPAYHFEIIKTGRKKL